MNKTTVNNLKDLHFHSQNSNELPIIPPQSTFQSEPSNHNRQSVILEDAQVPHEAPYKLSSLLQNKFDSIVTNSTTDVGRTNLFYIAIPTTGPPIAHKPYSIPLKYQKFIDEEIWILESAGCIS